MASLGTKSGKWMNVSSINDLKIGGLNKMSKKQRIYTSMGNKIKENIFYQK